MTFHDPTLDRVTEARGPVSERTLAELGALDAGFRFSRDGGASFPHRGRGIRVTPLSDLFMALPEHRVNIDIKDPSPDSAEAVMEVVRGFGRQDRTLLVSLHPHVQDRLARDWAAHPRAADQRSVACLWALALLGLEDLWRPDGDALQIPPRLGRLPVASPRLLAAARRHGVPVHVWTLNHPDDWDRYLGLGVDGIMSDDPGALIRHLEGRGLR